MELGNPKRRLAALLAAAALVPAIGACGGGDDEGDSGEAGPADAGVELTVYSGRQRDLIEPILDRFGEENGIKMRIRYGDTAALASQIIEEGDRSPADVFLSQDGGALGALEDRKVLAALPRRTLAKVASKYRSRRGRWVGTSGRARIVAYDKRELSESQLPDSVFDFTRRRWRGKLGWAPTNASFQAFITAMRKISGEERAERWLRDMVGNGIRSYPNNIAIRDAIAAGEIEAGFINHYYVAEAYAEEGRDYPVGIHTLSARDPGSLVNVAGVGILRSSEKRSAALRLVDFLLGREGQRYFARETREYPLAAGVRADSSLTPLSELRHPNIDLSDLDDLEGTLDLIERSGAL